MLWPIQNKANQSMRQMAALAPKMQELREKYKDDPTRMNQEVMKLYKQYGINPVGGCLPMVIQIPIFFGLSPDARPGGGIAEREVSLGARSFPARHGCASAGARLGRSILSRFCMAATQVWLMAMTPKTGDPTQRRVMMFTPLIFVFLLQFCGGPGIILHCAKPL